jgi:hypothetical protein
MFGRFRRLRITESPAPTGPPVVQPASQVKPFKVCAGGILVVPRSLIGYEEAVEVSSGGFLIILEEGQSPNDATEILAEHNRARHERDLLHYQR